jgi:hypothetical protein
LALVSAITAWRPIWRLAMLHTPIDTTVRNAAAIGNLREMSIGKPVSGRRAIMPAGNQKRLHAGRPAKGDFWLSEN